MPRPDFSHPIHPVKRTLILMSTTAPRYKPIAILNTFRCASTESKTKTRPVMPMEEINMELSSIDQTLLWNPPVKGDKVKKNTWIARKIKVRVNSALDRSIPRYGG